MHPEIPSGSALPVRCARKVGLGAICFRLRGQLLKKMVGDDVAIDGNDTTLVRGFSRIHPMPDKWVGSWEWMMIDAAEVVERCGWSQCTIRSWSHNPFYIGQQGLSSVGRLSRSFDVDDRTAILFDAGGVHGEKACPEQVSSFSTAGEKGEIFNHGTIGEVDQKLLKLESGTACLESAELAEQCLLVVFTTILEVRNV